MILRMLFGIFLLIFGVNKFLHFLEFPAIPGDGGTLLGIYATSGFLSLIGILEIVAGIALLANKFVPIALTIGVAILFNAAVFHLLHDPAGVAGAIVGLILGLVLVYTNRSRFGSFLHA